MMKKWIHYDNPKCKKIICETWSTYQPTAKPNILYVKAMLCIWCCQRDFAVLLFKLKRAIVEKCPEFSTRHKAIIFYHDNALFHVARLVRNYLENSGWKVYYNFFLCSGCCRTPSLEYGSHQNRVSEIELIDS